MTGLGTTDSRVVVDQLHAVGRPFVVTTRSVEVANRVADVLGDLRGVATGVPVEFAVELVAGRDGLPATARTHPWSVYRDGLPRETTIADWYLLPYLVWEITRLALEPAGDTSELLPIHAAALESERRAVVFPGATHAGKSTLAAWLTSNGWGYLSDELAFVRPGPLTVVPFPRPIGLRTGGPTNEVIRRVLKATPDDVGGRSLARASRLGRLAEESEIAAVVFLQRSPDGAGSSIQQLDPSSALHRLTQLLPTLRTLGRPVFRAAAQLLSAVPSYDLTVDDLDSARRSLVELIETGR